MDYLLVIILFLLAAKLGEEIAERVKMPPVMGELIMGIIIGPSVLRIVSPSEFTCNLAEIGIILLLFLAGLDTDISDLRRSGKSSFLSAVGGVFIPMLLGFVAAYLFGFPKIESIFIGAILTATSVGITVRTLVDMKKLDTEIGMTILGAAVIDDIIGIMILTILGSLSCFSLFGFFGVAGKILLFFALTLYLGLKFVSKAVVRIQRLRIPEALLSFSLIFMFIISFIAKSIGLAEIIGAFFAGIILHRTSQKDIISEKMYSIGYSIFIPIFFVNIGVETNIETIPQIGHFALAIAFVGIMGKVIGCGLGAKMGGFNSMDSLRIGVGMIPRMEVALIMARTGLRSGVIGESVFSITIVIVIITTFITPLLLKIAFRK